MGRNTSYKDLADGFHQMKVDWINTVMMHKLVKNAPELKKLAREVERGIDRLRKKAEQISEDNKRTYG